jgi:alkylation response protein AidB-like acyl-CoA dehydrogenase
MTDLDLLYTEDETELRKAVSALLAARCDAASVAAMYDGDRAAVDRTWRGLAGEIGAAGLLVPEELGGAGASAREAAVVQEEAGRAVAPVPFLTSAAVATTVLLADAATPVAGELLGGLAAGERCAALLLPLATGPGDPLPAVALDEAGTLSGTVTNVVGALESDALLVPARSGDGVACFAVRTTDATVEPVVSLDMSRQLADVTLQAAMADLVLPAGTAEDAVRRALLVGAGMLASEQLGVAQWCLTTTVDYLKERRQFGRVVGGFQALNHRLADLYVTVESMASAARYAAAALAAGDPDAEIAVRVAAAYCGDAAVHAAEEAIQLHGGIGMTWEHPAHLRLKRAKAAQLALGSPGSHRARLAALVDLPGVTEAP